MLADVGQDSERGRTGVSKSILQDEKKCFISGSTTALDRHHVPGGCRRKAAEKWGCWVWLRHDLHMELHSKSNGMDKMLKRACQERFEELYGHEKFMEVFGKSWL